MLKVVRFLELMWIVIAAASIVIGTVHMFRTSIEDALFFYFLAVVAAGLYYLRKKHRKKLEQDIKKNS